MVHFSQLISAAALVSVSSAVPMVRRYAPTATMNTDSSYQTGSYKASSSNMDSSYGSGHDSSYGSSHSSYASMDSGYASMDSSYASMDSSYASMDSSYASMDSSYGSMDSSYGSSDSSYGNTWNSMSTETMMQAMTSSSSSYAIQTSSAMYTQTSSAMSSQATYGSGSASWGGSSSSGYDSCVQQCSAQFGAPPSATTPPPSEDVSGTSTASSSGATHTIIVAPAPGVLQYVPFATNASVGDSIVYQWVGGSHTVTQSSAIEVCNKTASGFASGLRTVGSMFNQVINDTNPIWFYCGVPGHCEKGMFGGINIGNPEPSVGSNSSYMPMSSVLTDMAQDSDVSSAWNYTVGIVGSNSSLSNWGMDINCAGMNDDNKKQALLNIFYSQAVMAMNPDTFQNGKVVNASAQLKLPQQFAVQTNTTQNASSSSSSSSTTPSPTTTKNGVKSLLAPRYFIALIAVFASFTLM